MRYVPVDSKETSPKEPCFHFNFARNTSPLIGREGKLQEIKESFAEMEGPGRLLFICGNGGIGKSVLAKKYAELHKDEYDTIIEVSADAFEDVVRKIPLDNWTDPDEPQDAFTQRMWILPQIMEQQRVLLIVHDYNRSDDKPQWNQLPCDLLITTWVDSSDIGFQVMLPDQDLDLENAKEIFRAYFLSSAKKKRELKDAAELQEMYDKEQEAVGKLCLFVQKHPLSLRLLAFQMSWLPASVISPEEMLEELSYTGIVEHGEIAFHNAHEEGAGSKQEKNTAYGHLASIYKVGLSRLKLEGELLEAFRYMFITSPVYGISKRRFEEWTGLSADHLAELEKRGWINYHRKQEDLLSEYMQEGSGKGVYCIPMVIQNVLYQEEGLQNTEDNSQGFSDKCFSINSDQLIGYETRIQHWAQAEVIADHIKGDSCKMAYIYHEAGYIGDRNHFSLQQWKKTVSYQEKALEILRRVLGENHVDTASSYNNVAMSYEAMGDRKKDLEYQEKALDIRRRVLGENHVDTVGSYASVAMSCYNLGNYAKSQDFFAKAVEIAEKILGNEHPNTILYREVLDDVRSKNDMV